MAEILSLAAALIPYAIGAVVVVVGGAVWWIWRLPEYESERLARYRAGHFRDEHEEGGP